MNENETGAEQSGAYPPDKAAGGAAATAEVANEAAVPQADEPVTDAGGETPEPEAV